MVANIATIGHELRVLVLATAVLGCSAAAGAADQEDQDRVRQALGYLDGRQDAWSQFASAARGKGAEKTACVSCHTGISYALARPALRRFIAGAVTKPEERMIAAVKLRVEHWAELDSPQFRLMYDSDDQKKVESLGTEAVLNALILARDDASQGRKVVSPVTRRALEHLWRTQASAGNNTGSWDWLNFGLEPWEAKGSRTFGAALATMALGSAPGYLDGPLDDNAKRGVASLREYLQCQFPEASLYHRIWILEASTTFAGLLSAEEKKKVVEQLLALQRDDGGWALAALGTFKRVDGTDQARDSDGYATGLALHTLLRAGVPTSCRELVQARTWLRKHQQADGSWPGRSVNKKRDPATFVGKLMTDAATAIAASALVEAGSS